MIKNNLSCTQGNKVLVCISWFISGIHQMNLSFLHIESVSGCIIMIDWLIDWLGKVFLSHINNGHGVWPTSNAMMTPKQTHMALCWWWDDIMLHSCQYVCLYSIAWLITWFNEWMTDWINQSIYQFVIQWVNQLTHQSINQWINHLDNQPSLNLLHTHWSLWVCFFILVNVKTASQNGAKYITHQPLACWPLCWSFHTVFHFFVSLVLGWYLSNSSMYRSHLTIDHTRLKLPFKFRGLMPILYTANSSYTHQCISQQPTMIKPCLNFLNASPGNGTEVTLLRSWLWMLPSPPKFVTSMIIIGVTHTGTGKFRVICIAEEFAELTW